MFRLARNVLLLSLLAAAVVAVSSGVALAAGRLVHVEDCFNGNAGPYDYVVQVQRDAKNYHLLCGDPTKGVLHIDEGHPIEPGDERAFKDCIQNILGGSDKGPGNTPNTTVREWSWHILQPVETRGTGTLLYDNTSLNVLTAYTSNGASGNNWTDCALGNDGQIQ